MVPRGILVAIFFFLTFPANAQVCTGGSIGFDFGAGTVDASRNCVNLFWCHPPEPGGVEYQILPIGCDPTVGGCTVRATVPLRFPGNRNNSTAIGFFDSPAKLLWQGAGGGFVGSCGNFGARIQVDEGDAWIERSFACGNTGGGQIYDLQITVCDGVSGCQQQISVPVDLTDTAVSTAVCPGPPPQEDCDSCAGCFGFGGGFGAGGPGGEGGGGAPGAGGGGVAGGEGTGPGAHLRYKAGSLGRAGLPAPADWPLGRNWSHNYAARLLEDGDEVLLFTASAVFKTFRDTNLDSVYEEATPGDEYRTLEKTASGFTLTDLDGTVETFDLTGRWQSRTDRNGNTTTATYTGKQPAHLRCLF